MEKTKKRIYSEHEVGLAMTRFKRCAGILRRDKALYRALLSALLAPTRELRNQAILFAYRRRPDAFLTDQELFNLTYKLITAPEKLLEDLCA